MTTATQTAPTSPLEMLRSVSPDERLKLLRELVKLCFADGNLNEAVLIRDEKDSLIGALLPRTTKPLPPLTEEERIDLQRRIDNRHNAISHEEFIRRVRERIRERREN